MYLFIYLFISLFLAGNTEMVNDTGVIELLLADIG